MSTETLRPDQRGDPDAGGAPRRPAHEPARRLTPRREAALAAGVLLALTLVFFAPVLGGKTFSTVPFHQNSVYPWAATPGPVGDIYPQTDQADLSYPWQAYLRNTLHEGAFPFWDQHSFGGGYPLFANGQSALLYPPRLVTAWLLDPARGHDVFLMVHVFLAGLLTYLLMKEFGTGLGGALLAAVAWMFAGFNMAWLQLEVVTPMAVFLPLNVLCVHRAFRTGSWGWTVLAGLALAGTLLSGHLILLGIVYMVAVAYAAALAGSRVVRKARDGRWRAGLEDVARLGAMVAVSFGAAAFVLVPTSLVLSESMRYPFSYEELTKGGWGHLTGGAIPFLASPRIFLHTFWPPDLPLTARSMHEMAFVGTITACLAVVGAFVRRPGGWFGRVLFLGAFAVAVGGPATWLAYRLVPTFDVFRPYSRLVVLTSFAAAVLAGLGLDALWRWSRRASWRGDRLRSWRTSVPALVAAVSLVAVGGTSYQLIRHGRDVNPAFSPKKEELDFPATPLITAMQQEVRRPGQWPGRVLPLGVLHRGDRHAGLVLFAGEALIFQVDSTSGYDSVVPRRVAALMRVLQGEDPEAVLSQGNPTAYAPIFGSNSTRFDLLDRLGITTIVATPSRPVPEDWGPHAKGLRTETVYSGPDGRVLRVTGVRAGPRLVHGDEVVPTDDDALRRFVGPGFDAGRSVVLERGELERTGEDRLPGRGGTGRVLSATRGVNTARVTVESDAPAWLVVPDSWAPGWSARLDGKRADVLRANYVKRAVRVPAGRSEVTMRYRPAGFGLGLAVTVATLLASAAALAWRRRRGPQEQGTGDLTSTTASAGPRSEPSPPGEAASGSVSGSSSKTNW